MSQPQAYAERAAAILRELGIPSSYAATTGLPLQPETDDLVSIGQDIYDRDQKLSPAAARSWHALQAAAGDDGVSLLVVSAFRSVEYQRQIWERKLAAGEKLAQILRVSAAPGYSEHHTGRALDLTAPGSAVLTEAFALTPAFAWLESNAPHFGFALTFPRDNKYRMAYEPWHWAFTGAAT